MVGVRVMRERRLIGCRGERINAFLAKVPGVRCFEAPLEGSCRPSAG